MDNGSENDERSAFISQLRSIEAHWQAKWKESYVFEANPREDMKKYYITVPFPYPTGPLHIGHGRTYTMADVDARYRRLLGYNVLLPMGFHITGSPVESITAKIKNKDADTINTYTAYLSAYLKTKEEVERTLNSFHDPWKVVGFFSSMIDRDFNALGYSIDWRRAFTTGDALYSTFVSWQFEKLNAAGVISRGSYPVMYSVNEKQAVGEDDIKDGDTINPGIDEFVGIKFKREDGSYLICATLRPETLWGVTNIWINFMFI